MTNTDISIAEFVSRIDRLKRRAQDPEVIWLCEEVLSRVAAKTLPAKKRDQKVYMREYMRRRREAERKMFE